MSLVASALYHEPVTVEDLLGDAESPEEQMAAANERLEQLQQKYRAEAQHGG
jgi:hypothetical protein